MKFVDLGLPSHTLWADCNDGASTPTRYGKLYNAVSDDENLPSQKDFQELKHYTTHEQVNEGGGGIKFTSRTNGNSIFLPFAGIFCKAGLFEEYNRHLSNVEGNYMLQNNTFIKFKRINKKNFWEYGGCSGILPCFAVSIRKVKHRNI